MKIGKHVSLVWSSWVGFVFSIVGLAQTGAAQYGDFRLILEFPAR